jgi:hypothetical protein
VSVLGDDPVHPVVDFVGFRHVDAVRRCDTEVLGARLVTNTVIAGEQPGAGTG